MTVHTCAYAEVEETAREMVFKIYRENASSEHFVRRCRLNSSSPIVISYVSLDRVQFVPRIKFIDRHRTRVDDANQIRATRINWRLRHVDINLPRFDCYFPSVNQSAAHSEPPNFWHKNSTYIIFFGPSKFSFIFAQNSPKYLNENINDSIESILMTYTI